MQQHRGFSARSNDWNFVFRNPESGAPNVMPNKPPENDRPVVAPATGPFADVSNDSRRAFPTADAIVSLEAQEFGEQIEPTTEAVWESLLEKDLRDFLVGNLSEAFGQRLELIGTEVQVDVGRIDLLARDSEGTIWVIELKNRVCSREVIGQVLSYIGAIRKQHPSSNVRGVVVGPAFDDGAMSALDAAGDVVFFQFRVRYSLSEHAKSPSSLEKAIRQGLAHPQPWVIDVSKGLLFLRSTCNCRGG